VGALGVSSGKNGRTKNYHSVLLIKRENGSLLSSQYFFP